MKRLLTFSKWIVFSVLFLFGTVVLLFFIFEHKSREEYWMTIPKEKYAPVFHENNTESYEVSTKMDDLAKVIQDSVKSHLVKLVGNDYYSKLTYEGGQILKSTVTHKPTYYLHFSFSEPDLTIKKYAATVEVDEFGRLKSQIDLPNVKLYPHKSKIIDLRKAYKNALEYTLDYGDIFNVSITFNKSISSISWSFTFETEKGKEGGYYHIVEVDAHSGEIIDQHKSIIYKKGMIKNIDDFYDILDSSKY